MQNFLLYCFVQESLNNRFSIVEIYFLGSLLSDERRGHISFRCHHLASCFESNAQAGVYTMGQEIEKKQKSERKEERERRNVQDEDNEGKEMVEKRYVRSSEED